MGTYVLRSILKKRDSLLPFAERFMPPILDKSLDRSFDFVRCYGYEDEWGAYPPSFIKKEVRNKITSDHWTWMEERWGFDKGVFTIERWCLGSQQDAILFPEAITPDMSWYCSDPLYSDPFLKKEIVDSCRPFPGWQDMGEIGDRTCWLSPDEVFFVQGSVLVRVHIDSSFRKKEFTRRIAESVAGKLQEKVEE